jgi:D-sedoheptulose 7-phosphate isomerase
VDGLKTGSARPVIEASFAASIAAKKALAADEALLDRVEALSAVIIEALGEGNKVLFFGNGGSAADATHLAAEFVGRFKLERRPLAALSLTDNVSSVTAIGNDYSYDEVFVRPILGLGAAGDVAVGLSTSGGSRNVLAGLAAAGDAGLRTAAITGPNGLADPSAAELILAMPGPDTARVQECTMLVGHTVCEVVERALASR